MKVSIFLTVFIIVTSFYQVLTAQKDDQISKQPLEEINLEGLKWRNIGPALTSGRISDIAVNPKNSFEYYVATASGGVWKTINSGVTYLPVFDNEGLYVPVSFFHDSKLIFLTINLAT